jgi:hypothetical protein
MRRLLNLLRGRRKRLEDDLEREMRGASRTSRRRPQRRRSQKAGGHRARGLRPGPGGRARNVDLALARRRPSRRALRRAHPPAQPGLHGHRPSVAGHRHRRQRGDLLARGPGPLPPPAGEGAGAPRPHRLEGQRPLRKPGKRQPHVVPHLPRPHGAGAVLRRRVLPPPDDGEPRSVAHRTSSAARSCSTASR